MAFGFGLLELALSVRLRGRGECARMANRALNPFFLFLSHARSVSAPAPAQPGSARRCLSWRGLDLDFHATLFSFLFSSPHPEAKL